MTKYLSSSPFSVGGSNRLYSEGWEAVFGKSQTNDYTGKSEVAIDRLSFEMEEASKKIELHLNMSTYGDAYSQLRALACRYFIEIRGLGAEFQVELTDIEGHSNTYTAPSFDAVVKLAFEGSQI